MRRDDGQRIVKQLFGDLEFKATPISTRVNSVRHDDATLIERAPEAGADAQATAPSAPGTHAHPHEPPPEQNELF